MANTIVITKRTNNNVEVENDGAKYVLPSELRPFFNKDNDDGVDLRHADGTRFCRFLAAEVLQVVRQDTTVVPINDAETLYDELQTFFFDLAGSSTPLIPENQIVDTFAELPAPASSTDQIWYVRQQTGVWLLGTFRASGTYRSTGAAWVKDNEVSQFFVDNFMTFKDDVDQTKTAQFQVSAISSGTNRVFTFPDKDGIFAMLDDVSGKLDSVQEGTRITIDLTDPLNPIVNVDAATDAQIDANTSGVAANAVAISQNDTDILQLQTDLAAEILARITGDTGSVTIHNDVSDPGSGEIITPQERTDINASIDVHNDVDLSGVTIFPGTVFKVSGGQLVPTIKQVFTNPALIINNTNVLQDVINVQVPIQRLVPHLIRISYGWSLNDAAQDFVAEASLGGVELITGLTDNSEIHRQEPKDVAGGDPDGRGTNQRHRFSGTFFVTPAALGNNTLLLQIAGSANKDLASIWNTIIEIEEYVTIS